MKRKASNRGGLDLSYYISFMCVPIKPKLQPIVGRSFDVDDLILNFAGIVVGYSIAAIIKAQIKKKAE